MKIEHSSIALMSDIQFDWIITIVGHTFLTDISPPSSSLEGGTTFSATSSLFMPLRNQVFSQEIFMDVKSLCLLFEYLPFAFILPQ